VNSNRKYLLIVLPSIALLFLTATGCISKSSKMNLQAETKRAAAASDPSERHFDGGTYCVQTMTQGPPPSTPIHFSNKVNESDGSAKDFEADLSGDTLEQTIHDRHPATDDDRKSISDSKSTGWAIHDGFAEMAVTNHYARSDESAWSTGANGAEQVVAPWSLFINKPPETRVGEENVNGYETIKYTVDTTHQSQMDKSAGLFAGNLKDYKINGTAWVLKDANCVLQYNIDYEEDGMDGAVKKTHYEGTVSKK
jgi:hypothetical protein